MHGFMLEWRAEVLRLLVRHAPESGQRCEPLSLFQYGRGLWRAASTAGLSAFLLSPHAARHGGPSAAAHLGLLSLRHKQDRGRRRSPSSLRRFQTPGRLTKQVERMGSRVHAGQRLLSQ